MGRPPLSASRDRETVAAVREVLRRLRAVRGRVARANRELEQAAAARAREIAVARSAGLSWGEIGGALGLTREGARRAAKPR